MLPPAPVECLRTAEEIPSTSASITDEFAVHMSAACHANQTLHTASAEMASSHLLPSLPKSSSVGSDCSNRLEYWRAATGKGQKLRNLAPYSMPRPASALSRPSPAPSCTPSVGRVPTSRHRLSCDQDALASCCSLPLAGLSVREEASGQDSAGVKDAGARPPVFHQSASLGSCEGLLSAIPNRIEEASGDALAELRKDRAAEAPKQGPEQLSQNRHQVLQLPQERLTSYPSLGSTSELEESRCDTPLTSPSSAKGGKGHGPGCTCSPPLPAFHRALLPPSRPGPYPCLGGNSLRSQSDRMCSERISRLVSQDSLGNRTGPSPLERYHSLQDGDVIPRAYKQRTYSFGGPGPLLPGVSPLPAKNNVFEWAAQARMNAKVELSRRSSV